MKKPTAQQLLSREFDNKLRAVRLTLEHMEGMLEGGGKDEYAMACETLDEMADELHDWGVKHLQANSTRDS